jgi:hypothetical protein
MLFPARTGTGLGVFVMERFAELPTTSVAIAVLFPPFGSTVVDATETVSVIVVPTATLVLTFTTKVKLAVPIAIVVVSVHFRVPRTQVHPAGPVSETAVVLAGRVSVSTGAAAVTGPPLVTTCV